MKRTAVWKPPQKLQKIPNPLRMKKKMLRWMEMGIQVFTIAITIAIATTTITLI